MSALLPKADMFSVEIDVSFVPTAEVAEAIRPRSMAGEAHSAYWEAGLASGLCEAASTGFSGGA